MAQTARPDRRAYSLPQGRVDRRVVLKAAGAFGAMSALGVAARRPTRAQDAPQTRAATWVQAENVGGQIVDGDGALAFQTDFPFYAVGAHWPGAVGMWPRMELRFSPDGETWGDAVQMGPAVEDAGRPELEGRVYTDLAFASGANFVRYRAMDDLGNAVGGPVEGLAFTYIDATGGPTVDDVYAAALSPGLEPPPIITRAEWGANEGYRYDRRGELWPPEYERVKHVIIHHTATANFQDPLVAIRSVYYYHAVTRGWGDIGYNYLVDYLGNVYEGRYGGEDVVGGHSYQYAYGSSGIGTIGDFSFQAETAEAQAGLVWITAWVGRELDPYGTQNFKQIPDLPTICAHRDVNRTSCPGDFLYEDVALIRDYVAEVLAGADPAPADDVFAAGEAVVVAYPEGNLRGGPGVGNDVLAEMELGTELTVVSGPASVDGFAWYEVDGPYGAGWAASVILARGTSAPDTGGLGIGDEVAVETDVLNLRDAPALAGAVLAVLPTGVRGTVVDGPQAADGYRWFLLETEAGTGWSVDSYLSRLGGPVPIDGRFAVGDRITVDTDAVNLRSRPGLDNSVVATAPGGTEFEVTAAPRQGDGYVWYGLYAPDYGGGWAVADFLAAAGRAGIGAGDTVEVFDGALNFRLGPGLGAEIANVVPDGTRFSIVSGPVERGGSPWFEVENGGYGRGWTVGDYLRQV